MKKFTIASVILFAITCLFSCSKSSPGTPSKPTYTKCDVVSISCTSIPFTNQYGQQWDALEPYDNPLPDPYFTINDELNNALIKSPTVWNVSPANLPILWTLSPSFTFPDYNGVYTLQVWNDNTNVGGRPNDLMSTITDLSPIIMATKGNGYPTTVTNNSISSTSNFNVIMTLYWHN
jgi:hypothetical protein